MIWGLVILSLGTQPAVIMQAGAYATEKICIEAREEFTSQLDAESRKKVRAICLMAPQQKP